MSKPEHMPVSFEGKLVRLMEECAEVQQAAAKVLRFGDRSWNGGPTNGELLEEEMADLVGAIRIVRGEFATTTPSERLRKAAP